MSRVSTGDSVFQSLYQRNSHDNLQARRNLIASTKDSVEYVRRLGLQASLKVHDGCVNSVVWSKNGQYLLSGSDDQCLVVSDPHQSEILLRYKTIHKANIFSAKFLPESNYQSIVSCSGDGIVLYTELLAPYIKRVPISRALNEDVRACDLPTYEFQAGDIKTSSFNCHKNGTAYEVLTLPYQPKCFMSCGEDGTVRLFDLRQLSGCHKTCCKDNIIIFSPSTVNTMDLSPITSHYLAVGSSDGLVRVYDRRYLSTIDFSEASVSPRERHTVPVKVFGIPAQTKRQYRITCVQYSAMETQILASYSSEYLYLFDVNHPGSNVKELSKNGAGLGAAASVGQTSEETTEQVTRRLRLRGDWSDTGPDARPENDNQGVIISQVRPQLQQNILTRMTDVIARLLNDPQTRGSLFTIGSDLQRNVENAAAQIMEEDRGPDPVVWRNAAIRGGDRLIAMPGVPRIRTIPHTNNNNTSEAQPEQVQEESSSNQRSENTPSLGNDKETAAELDEELEKNEKDLHEYILMKYLGHRNARTMIKEATFWGDKHVMSGSDCGHVFIWNKDTGKLVKILQADKHVVNCLQPHPEFPYLASSGIDYDVKLWAPIAEKPEFNQESIDELVKRNAVMLEQTKDTITVPASFLIRMLACIHALRNRQNRNRNSRNEPLDSEDEEVDVTAVSHDSDFEDNPAAAGSDISTPSPPVSVSVSTSVSTPEPASTVASEAASGPAPVPSPATTAASASLASNNDEETETEEPSSSLNNNNIVSIENSSNS